MASATVIPIPLTALDWTMIFNLSERILHHMKVDRAVHSDPQRAFDSWIADHSAPPPPPPPPPAMPPPPPPSQRPISDVTPALRAVPVSPQQQQQPESTMDLYDDDDDDDDDEDSVIPTTEFMEE